MFKAIQAFIIEGDLTSRCITEIYMTCLFVSDYTDRAGQGDVLVEWQKLRHIVEKHCPCILLFQLKLHFELSPWQDEERERGESKCFLEWINIER